MPEFLSTEHTNYIDVEAALSRLRGNISLYCKLLTMYLNSKEFLTFEEHLAKNDLQLACDTIHSIKGLTGNLSLTNLFELSTELNKQLKTLSQPSTELLEKYRQSVIKTKDAVEAFLAKSTQ